MRFTSHAHSTHHTRCHNKKYEEKHDTYEWNYDNYCENILYILMNTFIHTIYIGEQEIREYDAMLKKSVVNPVIEEWKKEKYWERENAK